ncbi:hypothetical protein E3T40_04100 [Cryobacterium sp. TMT1-19]|uniref:hypothetical protein n=1 Tax=Cryobacterium sp. TMT1-19 TaxID=1259231 RepID=UPI00106BCDFD|nr:hypothetical protein [Cryobacterium sp. TMT1-19]TFD37779.1 hypothetical protein E3T40_04100 [Cryobacterium sp. TMT1-19]
MTKYEDTPEQAEASLQRSNDELSRLDNALTVVEARSEELERDIDDAFAAGDGERQAKAEEEMERVQQEVQDINTDLVGAHQYHADNQTFWFDS